MHLLLPLLAGILRALLAIAGGLIRLCPARLLPPVRWPEPGGTHSVGRRDLLLQSAPRLAARIWYPAEAGAGAPAPLFSDGDLRAMRAGRLFLPVAALERFGRTMTSSYSDVPGKRLPLKSPLVVFSHGLGGYIAQNTALAEALASQGCIVASIAHPGGAAAIAWPDGHVEVLSAQRRRRLLLNPALMHSMRAVRRAKSNQTRRAALLHHVRTPLMAGECERWATHVSAAITALEGDPWLAAYVDFDRIAAVGMSFGGAASALAAARDARIKAVVNLDGGQFCDELFERELPVPILVLQSQAARLVEGRAWNDFFYQRPGRSSLNAVRRYWAPSAGHLDFTDLTLLCPPWLRRLFGLRAADGQAMAATLSDVVTRFLQAVLSGHEFDARPDGCSVLTPHVAHPETAS